MELTIALALSILGSIISVLSFALTRKDKAIQNTKENHQALIEYQLSELKEDVKAILQKMDTYEKELKEETKAIVQEEIKKHILEYHSRKKEER